VVRGAANRGTCGQRAVTGTRMTSATAAWGFASPGSYNIWVLGFCFLAFQVGGLGGIPPPRIDFFFGFFKKPSRFPKP